MGKRPSWDKYFLKLCEAVSARSVDEDTQVGCVIVDQRRRIISTGYNGFPAGVNDEHWPRARGQKVKVPKTDVGLIGYAGFERGVPGQDLLYVQDGRFYEVDKYMVMAHAELNAVVAAGRSLVGCTLYSLLHPCHACAAAIITSGVKRVVFRDMREDPSWAVARVLLHQAGLEVRRA